LASSTYSKCLFCPKGTRRNTIFSVHSYPAMYLQIRLGDQAFDLHRDGDAFTLNGEPVDARFERLGSNSGLLILDGKTHVITFEQEGEHIRITTGGIRQDAVVKDETALLLEQFGFDKADSDAEREVHAPMPGLVLQVLVEPGQAVEKGQGLVVLEAMKMENELRAPLSGSVAAIHVAPGDTVGKNALLVELE